MMDAVREAVVAANHYRAEDVPELRMRMQLISTVPALAGQRRASTTTPGSARSAEFVGRRGRPARRLAVPAGRRPRHPGRLPRRLRALVGRADADLTVYLDAALRALAAGFAGDVITDEPHANNPRSPR